MTLFWVSIVVAVIIVLLAVGIPYLLTHRRMNPRGSEARAYLDATGKTPEDAALGRPGRPSRRSRRPGRRSQAAASRGDQQAGRPAGPGPTAS